MNKDHCQISRKTPTRPQDPVFLRPGQVRRLPQLLQGGGLAAGRQGRTLWVPVQCSVWSHVAMSTHAGTRDQQQTTVASVASRSGARGYSTWWTPQDLPDT